MEDNLSVQELAYEELINQQQHDYYEAKATSRENTDE